MSSHNTTTYVALDLIYHLENPAPAAPFLNVGDEQLDALQKLANIFNTALPKPKVQPSAPPTMQLLLVMPTMPASISKQQAAPSPHIQHIHHRTPRVNRHGSTRVPAPVAKAPQTPVSHPKKGSKEKQWRASTRVLTTTPIDTPLVTPKGHKTPHVIPPESSMPLPRTPPMYIPTPKGWKVHYALHTPPPHIIPQEPLQ
eukprot:4182236-Ditylum_brightwellii.AAC.1